MAAITVCKVLLFSHFSNEEVSERYFVQDHIAINWRTQDSNQVYPRFPPHTIAGLLSAEMSTLPVSNVRYFGF